MSPTPQKQNPAGGPGSVERQSGQAGDEKHNASPAVDLDEARRFLRALDPVAERFHFRTFPEAGGGGAGRNYHGRLDDVAVDLQLDNGNGRGIFVVVNEGGHKANEITRVRAVFADFDGSGELNVPGLGRPHIIVQSSAGDMHLHVYWLVDGLTLEQFKPTQQAIAARYKSDPSVNDLPRVMRLPGFIHRKPASKGHSGEPFRTTLLKSPEETGMASSKPYTAERVLEAFAPRATASVAAPAPPTAGFTFSPNADRAGLVVDTGRHEDMLQLAARHARQIHFEGLGRDAALAAFHAERDRGRWSREVADDEFLRALDGALNKCRSGEWKQLDQPTSTSWGAFDEPNRRRLTFRRVDELIANPKPLAWLIRGMLETDSLALIFGEPGVGKSFMAVDWSVCIATGTAFAGHKITPGSVLFIAGEGGNGLARRFTACAKAKGVRLDEAPLFVSTMASAMTDVDSVRELLAVVAGHIEQHGAPALIVVDTVARNFGPGDENSTKDMTGFIAACDALREQTGACVLLVHHSGHADKTRARGSIALKGALDWEYGLGRDPSGVLHLSCTKVKDAEPPAPLAFRLTSFDLGTTDDEGEPITSAVLVSTLFMPSQQGKAGRGKNQTEALRTLNELMDERRALLEQAGHDPDAANVPRTVWRDKCGELGILPKRFGEVFKSLRDGNHIVVDGHDRITLGDGHAYVPFD